MIEVITPDDELQNRTALLITETFSIRNTGMRTYTSDERFKLLQKEMNILYTVSNSMVTMRIIRGLLRRESAFAAFKRCYVRRHAAEYPELQQYVALDT